MLEIKKLYVVDELPSRRRAGDQLPAPVSLLLMNGIVVLERLRVASPCPARWEEMAGDDRVRFCGTCKKNVYNLSALQRSEAEALVARHEGKMCATFFQRADGTVLTADCPVGRRRTKVRFLRRVTTAAAALFSLLGGQFFTARPKPPAEAEHESRLGRPLAVEEEMLRQLVGSLGYVDSTE
jgi:hypothetical protein